MMTRYKPEYIEDINDIVCANRYIYDRGYGRKTAYLHYVDGTMTYDYCPDQWRGWRLMHIFVGERELDY